MTNTRRVPRPFVASGVVAMLAGVLLAWLPGVVGTASADSTITIRVVVPNDVEPTPEPTPASTSPSPDPSSPPGSEPPLPAPEPEPPAPEPEPEPLPRTGADVLPLMTAALAALLGGAIVLRRTRQPIRASAAPRKESRP